MSTKQVKVDNWGIYFLQRLKHFFNRTDYCDLTLQFQDNAQLKVHRLVLSACTEYFELLERTCEMYEDCLVMPDDLQADVVVPIVNFMYTGQLEFKQDLLEKLYQTSLVMNMPVLSKLLDAHRQHTQTNNRPAPIHSYSKNSKPGICNKKKMPVASSSGMGCKRSYNKAFEHDISPKSKKCHTSSTSTNNKSESIKNGQCLSDLYNFPVFTERNKHISLEPRPTRYELPEELDEDNVFDSSFTSLSYTSKPLQVHPETVKQYGSKKTNLFEDASSSKRFFRSTSTDIECRKITMNTNLFDDGSESIPEEDEIQPASTKEELKDASQLFDQIIENERKLTVETKDSKQVNNIDHAKIISEVLKKYPHLMKSNKNIKLKILDTPTKAKKKTTSSSNKDEKDLKPKQSPGFTYESDVIDSKEAARLIALGAENINGPWICLICGTPGKALHFTSYYKFRCHLVAVHNEKPVSTICEYCGLKSQKRNYLLHHLYTKHGVDPPPNYHFPKCNHCNYIALTEGFLVKHKLSHSEHNSFRCNACASTFATSNQLLVHIQKTGHKYSADRKANLQCIYCLKTFLRETNLYTHLKTTHKKAAKKDGIIDDSEDEKYENEESVQTDGKQKTTQETLCVKYEVPVSFDNSYESVQYQLEQKEDGNIQLFSKRPRVNESRTPPTKHKILNTSFESQIQISPSPSNYTPKKNVCQENKPERNDFLQDIDLSPPNNEEILLIDNNEYIIHNNQLIPKKERINDDYTMTNPVGTEDIDENMPELAAATLLEFQNIQTAQPQTSSMIVKKTTNINQPIQIVVSNEEEYKALMASNHSIIFDDGDPNKTLTVLTQGSIPLETKTIDLETSQSNEMMIIPDNYPMSVSDTVSADNSNIVVLYSHPIDDHNKQYQHITSQGIEAQFVQTSAIITQNFETVTTCTPIMSGHVVNTPVEGTWQDNIHENITQTSIANVTPIESITSSDLCGLPEIQLTPTKEMPIEISQQQIVTTNEVGGSVNVYTRPEDLQNNVVPGVAEEISYDNISTSETQTDIVNSLNLLEQNVVPIPDIEPETNIIIENSSQIDLSVLATVDTICHTTDPNNDTGITGNIDMSHTQTDDMSHTQTDDMSHTQTDDMSHTEADDMSHTQTDDMSHTQTGDISHTQTNDMSHTQTDDMSHTQTGDISHAQTNDMSHTQTDDMSNAVPEHVEEIQTIECIIHNEQDTDTPILQNKHQESQIVKYQEENIPKQSSLPNSVTIEVQHIQPEEKNPVSDQIEEETKLGENNELKKKTEIEETEENIDKDISADPNSIEKNIDTVQMPECVISEITKPVLTKINIKENIKNLTSEWSEDESDVTPEQTTHTISNLQESETLPEMEESIENIQQEMDNFEAAAKLKVSKEREQRKFSDQNEVVEPQNKIVSNEKISSLLDDWDDNDTQEDLETEQPAEEKDVPENENTVQKNVKDAEDINKDGVIIKSDKIKNLVSDWDEEEEQEIKD